LFDLLVVMSLLGLADLRLSLTSTPAALVAFGLPVMVGAVPHHVLVGVGDPDALEVVALCCLGGAARPGALTQPWVEPARLGSHTLDSRVLSDAS
jgi:hypothetical protein